MVTEDYVSYETAKLLNEKGFECEESPFYSEQDRDEWRQNNSYTIPNTSYDPDLPFDSETITLIVPHVSLQMAMKWLREVHNIAIETEWEHLWYAYVKPMTSKPSEEDCYQCESSKYEEACETAIRYCLENLI